ncbi:hypothetical protein D0B54_17945 [Solimonas sp. K1W22B-7]|uniref:hypothetical protein n=1 Tax=Solimonas sp. K1W22B-7 TaxID=2303331 RepID=UPI000E3320C1|nr:hypothetical protein [Solimonas sp. K1W22B-7]AXQ30443.1 hypothetical protein D0B54_17945 [Solimonas sp. K1W22B-7]
MNRAKDMILLIPALLLNATAFFVDVNKYPAWPDELGTTRGIEEGAAGIAVILCLLSVLLSVAGLVLAYRNKIFFTRPANLAFVLIIALSLGRIIFLGSLEE